MRTRKLTALIPTLTLFAATATAQLHPNIERGLPAGRIVASGEVDSVNGFNGSATLAIPIGQRWHVGARLSYQLVLTYGSNVWDFQKRLSGGTTYTQAHPNRKQNAGMGWTLSLGQLYAPNTPPYNDDTTKWLYVDPFGGEHYFYPTLHEGETQTSNYWYSRDGSHLRLYQWPNSNVRWIEYPDGTVHRFSETGSDWHLYGLGDRFVDGNNDLTNLVNVQRYTNQWQIIDTMGRTITVNFGTGAAGDTRVTSVVVAGVGTQTGTYTFAYTDVSNLPRSCRDDDPQTSDTVAVSLLSSVTLPDGSSYQLLSYNQSNAQGCDPPNLPGTLTSYRLPTGGRVDYTYIRYDFPYGCTGDWDATLKWAAGIGTRKLYDGATSPTLLGTWTYQRPSEQQTSEQVTTIVTAPQPVPSGECSGSDCTGNDTVYYYRIKGCKSTSDWSGWDHGLPFITGTSHTGGFTTFLSSRQYQGSSTTGTLKRATYVAYERDKLPSAASDDWFNSNRRLAGTRTVYEDDSAKYADVRFLNWDGLAQYRVAITGGTFGTGNERRTRSNFNQTRGSYKITSSNANDTTYAPLGYPSTYNPSACDTATTCDSPPHSFTMFPTSSPWIVDTFTFTEAMEGGVRAHTDFCFDAANGFLKRVRTLKTGATAGSTDLIAVFTKDDHGELAREQYYGGDTQTVNTSELCALTLPASDQYRIDYDRGTYPTYGDRLKARDYDQSGNPLSYYLVDTDIDRDTGLPTASRDSAGVQISFEYDTMGRLRWEKPQTSSPAGGAWVEHQYYT